MLKKYYDFIREDNEDNETNQTDLDYYLEQIQNNDEYYELTRDLYENIEDEGWLENLEDEYDKELGIEDFEYFKLDVTPSDKIGLIYYDDNTLEKFNEFDIRIKEMSEYPYNMLDFIDYDDGQIYIIRYKGEI